MSPNPSLGPISWEPGDPWYHPHFIPDGWARDVVSERLIPIGWKEPVMVDTSGLGEAEARSLGARGVHVVAKPKLTAPASKGPCSLLDYIRSLCAPEAA